MDVVVKEAVSPGSVFNESGRAAVFPSSEMGIVVEGAASLKSGLTYLQEQHC